MKQKIKQRTTTKIPQLKRSENFVQLLVEGKPFIILGGETHNSSTSSPRYMEEKVWERVLALHCNTVLTPVSWELVEPREGRFDFRLVDSLIKTARKRKLRLVLLWFGAWKNTRSNYAPSWVKQDLKRFERAQVIPGKNSDTISCLSESACTVESRAFAALMRHLHRFDGARHTVLMIQVENEVGLSGTARDHSPLAESCFRESVPTKLMAYLQSHRNVLDPTLRETWETSGDRSSGTWTEVFGRGADEIFMAWHIARYVDRVAQAGRSAYPLPMYVNAWLRQHAGQSPGAYPSGGPVAPVMDIWRCAAPSLILAPDMDEQNDFAAVCAEYTRGGHPLVIPEARRDERAAAHVFYAVGQHHALCFSPFGIEDVGADSLLADSYHILANMMPILTRYMEQTGWSACCRLIVSRSSPRRSNTPWNGGRLSWGTTG
jgi:beta-galactosidase GanA